MCPACQAAPGEPCRGKVEEPYSTIHGKRTRFDKPGVYVREGDDEWAREPASAS